MVDLEGARVAGVDPDDLGPHATARSTSLVVDLHQGASSQRLGPLDQADQRLLGQGRDDQQDQVGTGGAGLPQLIGRHDGSLRSTRMSTAARNGGEVGQGAGEPAFLGGTEMMCAPPAVGGGQRRGSGCRPGDHDWGWPA